MDVNIYSSGGAAAEKIRGNVENTQIGEFLSEYLDVDVEAITRDLEDKMEARPEAEVKGLEAGQEKGETGGHPAEWFREVGL